MGVRGGRKGGPQAAAEMDAVGTRTGKERADAVRGRERLQAAGDAKKMLKDRGEGRLRGRAEGRSKAEREGLGTQKRMEHEGGRSGDRREHEGRGGEAACTRCLLTRQYGRASACGG